MRKSTITFANGNRAVVVTASCHASARAILDALEMSSPPAVIVLFGGTKGLDDSRKARVATLFGDGVAQVAAELGALIIDGGIQSGVMAMMGEALAARPGARLLLGIAPAGKVTYSDAPTDANIVDGAPLEPNHSHFVLVESDEWGGETGKMLELVREFNAPIVAILVNGGAIAQDEAWQSVRNAWQLLVIEGSGRFADELSEVVRNDQPAKSVKITEIARSGRVVLFNLNDAASTLKTQLRRMFSRT